MKYRRDIESFLTFASKIGSNMKIHIVQFKMPLLLDVKKFSSKIGSNMKFHMILSSMILLLSLKVSWITKVVFGRAVRIFRCSKHVIHRGGFTNSKVEFVQGDSGSVSSDD